MGGVKKFPQDNIYEIAFATCFFLRRSRALGRGKQKQQIMQKAPQ